VATWRGAYRRFGKSRGREISRWQASKYPSTGSSLEVYEMSWASCYHVIIIWGYITRSHHDRFRQTHSPHCDDFYPSEQIHEFTNSEFTKQYTYTHSNQRGGSDTIRITPVEIPTSHIPIRPIVASRFL
jgi:hypothetical protein